MAIHCLKINNGFSTDSYQVERVLICKKLRPLNQLKFNLRYFDTTPGKQDYAIGCVLYTIGHLLLIFLFLRSVLPFYITLKKYQKIRDRRSLLVSQ